MKIEMTDLSPVKKQMRIEVDAEEVAKERRSALRKIAAQAKIPGFRKGKAPLSVVRARFAKELDEDLRDRMLSRYFGAATRDKGLKPVGDPVLDEVVQEEGQPFSFKTTFDVLPEIELRSYRGVDVRRPAIAVGEEEIRKMLEELRQSRIQLVTEEERAAITGDVILADVEGNPRDGSESFKRERMLIEIGATESLPAFNEALLGSRAGSKLEFPVEYPKEYGEARLAGKVVDYKLQIHEVKRQVVPELDDEFAKDLGDFDDLGALRTRIREDLEARKKHEVEQGVRQSVLDKVLLENAIALPDALVEDEIRHRLEQLVRGIMRQGVDPEKLELDWKEMRRKQEEPARKSVHARLILDAVAEAESIEVAPREIDDRIRRDAQALGEKPENLRKRLQEHGGIKVLSDQLLREKTLDLLTSVANIQDEE